MRAILVWFGTAESQGRTINTDFQGNFSADTASSALFEIDGFRIKSSLNMPVAAQCVIDASWTTSSPVKWRP